MEGTLNQPYIALLTVYAGIAAGAVYFSFRRIAKLFNDNAIPRYFLDALFIVILGIIAAVIFYRAAYMRLRFYYVVGLALGFAIYTVGIHPMINAILNLFHGRKKKIVNKEKE